MRGSINRRPLLLAAAAVSGLVAAVLTLATSSAPAQAQASWSPVAPAACTCTAADAGRGIRLSNCQCGAAQCFITDTSAGAVNLQCLR